MRRPGRGPGDVRIPHGRHLPLPPFPPLFSTPPALRREVARRFHASSESGIRAIMSSRHACPRRTAAPSAPYASSPSCAAARTSFLCRRRWRSSARLPAVRRRCTVDHVSGSVQTNVWNWKMRRSSLRRRSISLLPLIRVSAMALHADRGAAAMLVRTPHHPGTETSRAPAVWTGTAQRD